MSKLTVFRNDFVMHLHDNIDSNKGFYRGICNEIYYNFENTLTSNIVIPDSPPVLDPSCDKDMENAIKIYEYLHQLNETQASDIRLWTYMTHVTFKDYTRARWSISDGDLENKKIEERWFFKGGGARSLRRNAISRLWWTVHLTVAPWEKDQYFDSIADKSDRYVYTKVLSKIEDLASALMERRLSWSKKVLISMLEYMRQNEDFVYKREFYRNFLKEINLDLGYKKIMIMTFDELLTEINSIAWYIKNIIQTN